MSTQGMPESQIIKVRITVAQDAKEAPSPLSSSEVYMNGMQRGIVLNERYTSNAEKPKIDDKILQVLSDAQSHGEWDIAFHLYNWSDSNLRSKRGAWIRCIVQSLWRLHQKGWVDLFWVSHGEGVPGDRMWFRCKE